TVKFLSFDDLYQNMEDLIKLFWANSFFEMRKVSLTGNTIIGYSGISPITASFVFVMETRDKVAQRFKFIQVLIRMKDKKRSRIKAVSSLSTIG
ncbi:unnamed protein product, partial [marine sediment metagenome]